MDYLELVAHQEKKTIAIDFDGVLHDDYLGFYDGTIYGRKFDGVDEGLKFIFEMGYTIVIFTAKAKPDRPLIGNKSGVELVWDWLKKHNLDKFVTAVTAEKPRALLYIDDKAVRHTDWVSTLNFVRALSNEV